MRTLFRPRFPKLARWFALFVTGNSMIDRFPRDLQPEIMDQPGIREDVHRQALRGLARLNRYTRVAWDLYKPIFRHAMTMPGTKLRILDVASGSGDLPIQWLRWSKRDGLDLDVCALDVSQTAIDEQQRRATHANVRLRSIRLDCFHDQLPDGFDMVTNSLFMHHLDNTRAIELMRSMMRAARIGVLVCDLERTRLNLRLVNLAARLLSRSMIVHHDADRSVRAAYRIREFAELATAASSAKAIPRRLFPCRFVVSLPPLASAIRTSESLIDAKSGEFGLVS